MNYVFVNILCLCFIKEKCEGDFFGDIPNEKFNIIMRCAYFGKKVLKDCFQMIENYCVENQVTIQELNSIFKDCLVSKEIVYQSSDSSGIVIIIVIIMSLHIN